MPSARHRAACATKPGLRLLINQSISFPFACHALLSRRAIPDDADHHTTPVTTCQSLAIRSHTSTGKPYSPHLYQPPAACSHTPACSTQAQGIAQLMARWSGGEHGYPQSHSNPPEHGSIVLCKRITLTPIGDHASPWSTVYKPLRAGGRGHVHRVVHRLGPPFGRFFSQSSPGRGSS